MTVVPPEIAGRLTRWRATRWPKRWRRPSWAARRSHPLHVLAALLPTCDELRAAVERRAVDPD